MTRESADAAQANRNTAAGEDELTMDTSVSAACTVDAQREPARESEDGFLQDSLGGRRRGSRLCVRAREHGLLLPLPAREARPMVLDDEFVPDDTRTDDVTAPARTDLAEGFPPTAS